MQCKFIWVLEMVVNWTFCQITFFPILVNFAPIWPDIEQVTLTNHTSHKPNSFANDQTTLGLMPCQVIWVYMRKANRVVHEKSVKMQLLQILLQIKPPSHIWTEIILAKYERPHFKNERAKVTVRRRPSHYIGEIVKVGYGLSVSKWSKGGCLNST